MVCVSEHPAPYEGDEPSSYNYENDLDTSEYCPNVALVSTLNCLQLSNTVQNVIVCYFVFSKSLV